jgi:hypothetical protein
MRVEKTKSLLREFASPFLHQHWQRFARYDISEIGAGFSMRREERRES